MAVNMPNETEIDQLEEWFRANEQLPAEIDRLLLKRFFQSMNNSMEETKSVILINYAIRNKYATMFLTRDPLDEDTKATMAYCDLVILPKLTPDGCKVSCIRLCDEDPTKMRHNEDTKAFFMFADCRFILLDSADLNGEQILSSHDIHIFDMAGYSMKHVSRLRIATLRMYIKFLQEAFPVRLKAMHMINCPPYLDKIVALLKPFINREVFKLINFHTEGMASLYAHVPQHLLPEEYGGQAGKFCDLKANMLRNMVEKRDYLMNPKFWKVEGAETASGRWNFF